MYQNKLLCFKMCYCLGVGDDTLQCDFAELHEIAKSTGYYDTLKVARTYRAISRVYYTVARHSELYTPEKSFAQVAGQRFKPYLEGTDFVPELVYQDAGNVKDFLGKLAEMSHQLLPSLYAELKPALDYMSFEMLLHLKPLSTLEMQKVHYILRRIPVQYNIYFFASDLFNVAMRDMLKTDAALRKCISIVTGRQLDKSADTSDLAKELDKRDDGYFVSASGLMTEYKNIYFIQKDLPADVQAKMLTLFSEASVPLNVAADTEGFLKVWDEREDVRESLVVIAKLEEEDLLKIREHCEGVNAVLLIPIARMLYRKVLSGEFDRVALLSLR